MLMTSQCDGNMSSANFSCMTWHKSIIFINVEVWILLEAFIWNSLTLGTLNVAIYVLLTYLLFHISGISAFKSKQVLGGEWYRPLWSSHRLGVKGTKTCSHVMTGKGTPPKSNNFAFPKETAIYFAITPPPNTTAKKSWKQWTILPHPLHSG